MFDRFFAALALLAFSQPALAACSGSDLRATLTPAEQVQLDAVLQDIPFPQGNHWRATRGDTVINLIGTMHLNDPRLDAPTARLRAIVESSDLLMLEMTAEDETEMQTRLASDPEFLMLQDTTLPELLTEQDWQIMSAAMEARGLPPFMAARFQPWYVSILLAIPPCAMTDDLTAGGLDARLEAIATDADVPRVALEDADSIFALFTDQPLDEQIEMMLSGLIAPQDSENLFATLLASYFDENTAEGWHMSAILAQRYTTLSPERTAQVFAQMEDALLTQRNIAWIDVILEATQDHDLITVAAGAAHWFGDTGVLNLLQDQGFTLTRAPF